MQMREKREYFSQTKKEGRLHGNRARPGNNRKVRWGLFRLRSSNKHITELRLDRWQKTARTLQSKTRQTKNKHRQITDMTFLFSFNILSHCWSSYLASITLYNKVTLIGTTWCTIFTPLFMYFFIINEYLSFLMDAFVYHVHVISR